MGCTVASPTPPRRDRVTRAAAIIEMVDADGRVQRVLYEFSPRDGIRVSTDLRYPWRFMDGAPIRSEDYELTISGTFAGGVVWEGPMPGEQTETPAIEQPKPEISQYEKAMRERGEWIE